MSRRKGDLAEERAADFLQKSGFRILERNFYSRFGEIDIIALKDETLHFVEVKSGQDEPIYKINASKLSKIIKTAQIYLNKKRVDADYCFDAIIVSLDDIEFIENITL